MSDFDRNYATMRGVGTDHAVAYDMGLRAHMIRVYNYMASGVALTGVVAWFTYQMAVVTSASGAITGLTPFGQAVFGSPLKWVLILAPLGLVFFLSFRIQHMQAATARLLFFVYAGLLGMSLAVIFMVYTQTSITRVFFISAAAFGALSLYGYTTQRSLNAMGSFLTMGLFGLIIALAQHLSRCPCCQRAMPVRNGEICDTVKLTTGQKKRPDFHGACVTVRHGLSVSGGRRTTAAAS